MLMESPQAVSPNPTVLDRLRQLCAERGMHDLAENLAELGALVGADMAGIELELGKLERLGSAQLNRTEEAGLAEQAARYLMSVGGKRLRPMCVALASRVGEGFDERSLDLGVAAELIHNATLLHDDVVDLAPTRRGLPTARSEFNNAASIFGGDWLLIEALRRVVRADVGDSLERLLDTIEEMIRAESLQLEQRGSLSTSEDVYFQIVEGKSAVLFRWALYAGGKAGGLNEADCAALEEFGSNLGVAFQIVDDLLDFTGKQTDTGKALFTDLREGKMTYPLILANSRDSSLMALLQRAKVSTESTQSLDPLVAKAIVQRLESTGSLADSRALAEQRVQSALDALARLSVPGRQAVTALALVAQSTLHRDR